MVGLAGSLVVIALAGRPGPPTWLAGPLAPFAWHLPYVSTARTVSSPGSPGRPAPAGARLDILCDLAVQIALVTALSVVAMAHRPSTPILAARHLRRHLDGQPAHLADAARPAGGEPAAVVSHYRYGY